MSSVLTSSCRCRQGSGMRAVFCWVASDARRSALCVEPVIEPKRRYSGKTVKQPHVDKAATAAAHAAHAAALLLARTWAPRSAVTPRMTPQAVVSGHGSAQRAVCPPGGRGWASAVLLCRDPGAAQGGSSLEVAGVGPVRLPLDAAGAAALKPPAGPAAMAPFGRGEETVTDEGVRHNRQLEPGQFTLTGKGECR